ncbi:MAG TPA: alanine racemase [Vicinamibacterales bacterium]|nr:alanine racemase [Vicinamibacterales bacterium]
MIRQTVATVSLEAVRANVDAIRGVLAERDRPPAIIGVVKANAYGHGAVEVGAALEAAGVAMLACADIEEGVALRRAGIRTPILVFGALSVSDLDGVFDHDLTPTISTPGAARALARAAEARGVRLACHLKIDTGMNRLGFRHDNLRTTMPEVLARGSLEIEAVYTHFATADDPESPFMEEQRVRFDRATAALGALGLPRLPRHAANSAALLRDTRTWFDWVRPGLLLYGIVPPPLAAADLPLRPALSLRSRIVAVKGLRVGEGTGYGLRYVAETPRTVAIVPAGYADGLDTRLANRGSVLVRGRRAPVIGSVCMDMITIDVTGTEVAPGDEVVIIGRQEDDEISARETAAAIGAIPWEVVCRLGARIERRYARHNETSS